MQMNLNRANYILTILEEGSISAAAHKLFISQAALSQTVRLVEEEVGLPILEREKGVLKLTFAGERYVDTVKQMMLLEKSFRNEIDEIKREQSGQFRFGILSRNGKIILPHVMPKFLKEYPLVQLQVTEKGSGLLTQMVAQGDLDLAIVRAETFEKRLVYRLLQKDQLGIFAGRGSRIFDQYPDETPLHISQAAAEKFVFLKEGRSSRESQERLMKNEQVQLHAIVDLDAFETATQMVMSCGAVMIAHRSALHLSGEELEKTHFYPLIGAEDEGSIYLIYHEAVYLTPYMRRWMELVEEMFEQLV